RREANGSCMGKATVTIIQQQLSVRLVARTYDQVPPSVAVNVARRNGARRRDTRPKNTRAWRQTAHRFDVVDRQREGESLLRWVKFSSSYRNDQIGDPVAVQIVRERGARRAKHVITDPPEFQIAT